MPDEYRRNKGSVRVVAFLDMILSLALFIFYFSILIATNTLIFKVSNGPFSKLSLVVVSLILWAIIFGITYVQLLVSYKLFLVTFQDALGPKVAVERAMSWMRTAALLFGFIGVKIIFCQLRFENPIWVFWLLCVIEIVFRMFGLYFVREFCDDLKHHIRLVSTQAKSSKYSNDESERVPQVLVSNHVENA